VPSHFAKKVEEPRDFDAEIVCAVAADPLVAHITAYLAILAPGTKVAFSNIVDWPDVSAALRKSVVVRSVGSRDLKNGEFEVYSRPPIVVLE
jgi:hypothetical protein